MDTQPYQNNINEDHSLAALLSALQTLRDNKPTERSELARVYAVTITEVEKAAAYFEKYAAS